MCMEENKQEILMLLAINLKRIRRMRGLTQEELAVQCGFDRTYISMLERAKRNPSLTNLVKICRGLGVDLSDILKEI